MQRLHSCYVPLYLMLCVGCRVPRRCWFSAISGYPAFAATLATNRPPDRQRLNMDCTPDNPQSTAKAGPSSSTLGFFQSAPRLENQFSEDTALRRILSCPSGLAVTFLPRPTN